METNDEAHLDYNVLKSFKKYNSCKKCGQVVGGANTWLEKEQMTKPRNRKILVRHWPLYKQTDFVAVMVVRLSSLATVDQKNTSTSLQPL